MPLVGIQSRNPVSPRTASIDQSSFGAPGLDRIADALEGQVERGLSKLLDELAGVRFVSSGCQLVMNRQAHIVSLPVIVQRPGQRVTKEMALAARTPTR
jgi:hypothetical protein